MGRRNRERVQRIIEGKEQPIASESAKYRKASPSDMERQAVIWSSMALAKQVGEAKRMVRIAGEAKFKANFMKPTGFPSDLRDKQNQGMKNEEIYKYYWDCPEFVEFWHSLGWNEEDFLKLLDDEVIRFY